jgi:hypothetical protein
MRAIYRFKSAALDPKLLEGVGGKLEADPFTVSFKTPAGHTITTPYSDDVVAYQQKRLGSPEAYYNALSETFHRSGMEEDAAVERRRDDAVSATRAARALGGAVVGGTLGRLAGGFAKNPGLGKLVGTALGTAGGATVGGLLPVTRQTGVESRYRPEISELYQEPESVKEMRAIRGEIEALSSEIADDRYLRRLDALRPHGGYYDPYDPYDPYGRYPPYGRYRY